MSLTVHQNKPGRKAQSGIVLLVLVIVIALTVSAYYFSGISVVDIQVDNKEKTRKVLLQAKQALINYAVTHADGNGGGLAGEFGYLPCPDSTTFSSEGGQDPGGNCRGIHKSRLGYLPWRSLDLAALKDSSGSCLWYVVSGNYKGENASGLVNEDTDGFFQIVNATGDVLQDKVIALVLAPGVALAGQTRTIDVGSQCGEDYGNEAAYLEGTAGINNWDVADVADSPDRFIHATLVSDSADVALPYNDNFITITHDEIWSRIMKRSDIHERFNEAAEALAQCLAEYVNDATNSDKRLPWPAPLDVDGGDYRVMNDYSDKLNATSGYAGRFPFHIDDSNNAITTTLSDVLIDNTICSNMSLPVSGLTGIDLSDPDAEHRLILENWKDHFFYASSKDYSVTGSGPSACAGNCVKVGAKEYAAIVFFSGSPINAQNRTLVDKTDVANYLENNNPADFNDAGGNSVYETTDVLNSNDIMFCITTDTSPVVEAC